MSQLLAIAAGIGAGLLLLWLALVAPAVAGTASKPRPDQPARGAAAAARADPAAPPTGHRPTLPRGVRIQLGLLLAYLLLPIDLIPDFIPVIIIAVALRSFTRRAGPAALDRHPHRARRAATTRRTVHQLNPPLAAPPVEPGRDERPRAHIALPGTGTGWLPRVARV